ncbi:PadR family transcriptional regulator [Asticcacaulis sp. YBE204]|uniref:PadR family transcriptional regulator n=1 Tax=Asticcacaulis sp. YBE204 TaxID=1282363 RepID=UPI00040036CC|nr:helix-turn-helix transcriptional regulator [Asticcacaulis sp. YBE204]
MSRKSRRLSPQTLSVLTALSAGGQNWLYGLELSAATGLKSGSLYPILIRLSERGLVEGQWLETEKPGRPPRHAYRLTGQGRAALIEVDSHETAPFSAEPRGV